MQSVSAFGSPAYKRSRLAYIWECTFEYFSALLILDVFLAAFLQSMNMPDSLIGILSSCVSGTQFIQLAVIFVAGWVAGRRRLIIWGHFITSLFFSAMYLVPFLPVAQEAQWVLIFVCLIIGYCGKYFFMSPIYRWGNSFVRHERQGLFSATKQAISLVTGMVVSLAASYMMNLLLDLDQTATAFIFISVCITVFNVCDFVCLLLMKKEPQREEREARVPFRVALSYIAKSRVFRETQISMILYYVAVYATTPFLGAHKLNIGYTVFAAQILTTVATVFRALAMRPHGQYCDRRSFVHGIELANLVMAVSFVFLFFAGEGPWHYFFIPYFLLYSVGQVGISGYNDVLLHDLDNRYFVQALALRYCIAGTVGFLTTLVFGALYDPIEALDLRLFGTHLAAPQIFAVFSFVVLLISVLYTVYTRKKHAKE